MSVLFDKAHRKGLRERVEVLVSSLYSIYGYLHYVT